MIPVIIIVFFIGLLRLYIILPPSKRAVNRNARSTSCSLAVFLGSGGHTSEALALISSLDFNRYSHRTYFITEGDNLSAAKAAALEKLKSTSSARIPYTVLTIPRARRVHQSLLTTPATALASLLACIYHVTVAPFLHPTVSRTPSADVLIVNGPGTCVVLCIAVYVNRFVGLPSPKLLYVESFARAQSLSLSGKLLRPFVDRFIVQWPSLRDKGEYHGWLV